MQERRALYFFICAKNSNKQTTLSFFNPVIIMENFCLSERLAVGFYKPVRRWRTTKNSPAAGSHKWEGETVKGNEKKNTYTRPSGDFISLPVIAQLNNSGQGITSSGLSGSEQQSHAGGK